jgi:hypothetical protein
VSTVPILTNAPLPFNSRELKAIRAQCTGRILDVPGQSEYQFFDPSLQTFCWSLLVLLRSAYSSLRPAIHLLNQLNDVVFSSLCQKCYLELQFEVCAVRFLIVE